METKLPKTEEVGVAVFLHTTKINQPQSKVPGNRFCVLDCKDMFVLYCCLCHPTSNEQQMMGVFESRVVLCVDVCCL